MSKKCYKVFPYRLQDSSVICRSFILSSNQIMDLYDISFGIERCLNSMFLYKSLPSQVVEFVCRFYSVLLNPGVTNFRKECSIYCVRSVRLSSEKVQISFFYV